MAQPRIAQPQPSTDPSNPRGRPAEPILASNLVDDDVLDELFTRMGNDKGKGKEQSQPKKEIVNKLASGMKSVDDALNGGLREGSVVGVSGNLERVAAGVQGSDGVVGAWDLSVSFLITSLLANTASQAAIIFPTGDVDIRRIYDLILARLRANPERRQTISSLPGCESLGIEKLAMKVLSRVIVMRVRDLIGIIECIDEIRDTLEGKKKPVIEKEKEKEKEKNADRAEEQETRTETNAENRKGKAPDSKEDETPREKVVGEEQHTGSVVTETETEKEKERVIPDSDDDEDDLEMLFDSEAGIEITESMTLQQQPPDQDQVPTSDYGNSSSFEALNQVELEPELPEAAAAKETPPSNQAPANEAAKECLLSNPENAPPPPEKPEPLPTTPTPDLKYKFILLSDPSNLILSLQQNDYEEAHTMAHAVMRSLNSLTKANNLYTIITTPVKEPYHERSHSPSNHPSDSSTSTSRPKPTENWTVPQQPGYQDKFTPPPPHSIFASNRDIPGLVGILGLWLDVNLLLHRVPRGRADVKALAAAVEREREKGKIVSSGIDAIGFRGVKTHWVFEVLKDRWDGRVGDWGVVDVGVPPYIVEVPEADDRVSDPTAGKAAQGERSLEKTQ